MGLPKTLQRVAESVAAARQLYPEAPRPVSPDPYTLDSVRSVIPFTVTREHPAWAGIRSAEAALAGQIYGQQHQALQADLEAGLVDDLVAKLLHMRVPNGMASTVAPWTDTVPMLPPGPTMCR